MTPHMRPYHPTLVSTPESRMTPGSGMARYGTSSRPTPRTSLFRCGCLAEDELEKKSLKACKARPCIGNIPRLAIHLKGASSRDLTKANDGREAVHAVVIDVMNWNI